MSLHRLFLLLLLGVVVDPTRAFSAATPKQTSAPGGLPTFREVLGQAGKKIFRPGGSVATEKLHSWARGIDSNSQAVEFATGPGTGMDLVVKTGCRLLVTDPPQNRETLEKAKETARQRGILDKVDFLEVPFMGDSLDWTKDPQQPHHFDVAIVEAVLTKYPRETKVKILQQLHDVTDQLLLHEIAIRGCETDEGLCATGVKDNVGSALAETPTGYNPLTTEGWIHVLEESGFLITDIETGPIRLIEPATMVQDEGVLGAVQIGFNLATHDDLRERFFRTRDVLEDYKSDLGYVIVHAVSKK